ncbi:hypothetical protein ONS95_003388 [Cadophora gregata]|uniref:uncharacterized protein n=1 Tax=Cadophora gregata TaxID=51156 RepID=UPI0026DC78C0|nr:uncharacterized protein ONS95_003388 [Cadophora gregata]KAK0108591.1 hypothetical protein ONS95_003388 [Cadophora gregata]KAK0108816.1 hypothetical protein ONS96_002658 [Cadophora gregata f. sp. sojae]
MELANGKVHSDANAGLTRLPTAKPKLQKQAGDHQEKFKAMPWDAPELEFEDPLFGIEVVDHEQDKFVYFEPPELHFSDDEDESTISGY